MFSHRILDHFENPRNSGELSNSDARVLVENPVCGDVLELSVLVRDRKIHQARFRAKGCVPLMACSSILAEMLEGLSLQEAASLNLQRLLESTGPLPRASSHAAEMAVQAVHRLLRKIDPAIASRPTNLDELPHRPRTRKIL